jgi:hypothetical protein
MNSMTGSFSKVYNPDSGQTGRKPINLTKILIPVYDIAGRLTPMISPSKKFMRIGRRINPQAKKAMADFAFHFIRIYEANQDSHSPPLSVIITLDKGNPKQKCIPYDENYSTNKPVYQLKVKFGEDDYGHINACALTTAINVGGFVMSDNQQGITKKLVSIFIGIAKRINTAIRFDVKVDEFGNVKPNQKIFAQ